MQKTLVRRFHRAYNHTWTDLAVHCGNLLLRCAPPKRWILKARGSAVENKLGQSEAPSVIVRTRLVHGSRLLFSSPYRNQNQSPYAKVTSDRLSRRWKLYSHDLSPRDSCFFFSFFLSLLTTHLSLTHSSCTVHHPPERRFRTVV